MRCAARHGWPLQLSRSSDTGGSQLISCHGLNDNHPAVLGETTAARNGRRCGSSAKTPLCGRRTSGGLWLPAMSATTARARTASRRAKCEGVWCFGQTFTECMFEISVSGEPLVVAIACRHWLLRHWLSPFGNCASGCRLWLSPSDLLAVGRAQSGGADRHVGPGEKVTNSNYSMCHVGGSHASSASRCLSRRRVLSPPSRF